ALAAAFGATTTPNHPDMAERVRDLASRTSPESLLTCIESILECREALAQNVKPRFAVAAMAARLSSAFR
ncbi:DNA polymerase III subunit delta' C-terminal domain-containing protein, partial [Rhodococcus sp. CX]|uniref:DNA polymerase III subunit delta' C-terminal domain-containing protein n=3 Tax=unclassified Rhodococcus (in: high G+C Gram-positive bacteria) TaxID=192944 RepID=UPI0027DE9CE9